MANKNVFYKGRKTARREPFTKTCSSTLSPFTLNHEPKMTLNREPLTLNQGRPEPKRKRGKLAPLMTEEAKATASIHELSYDFGCRITRLFQYLTEDSEYKEYVQSKQI